MDVRFITSAGVESCDPSQLPDLLTRTDGLVWVEMPTCDKQAEENLATVSKAVLAAFAQLRTVAG